MTHLGEVVQRELLRADFEHDEREAVVCPCAIRIRASLEEKVAGLHHTTSRGHQHAQLKRTCRSEQLKDAPPQTP